MTKTKIIETTEKYDENGKLIERIIKEETSEDDSNVEYIHTSTPIIPNIPTCTCATYSEKDCETNCLLEKET